ncbi:MAG: hypothetical protein WA989_13795 [Henriciella sp.]|uniref:hypothetical protein n=1 Tax=Henriciella sp. TaxID=1968823 RepID=UPI003C70A2B4
MAHKIRLLLLALAASLLAAGLIGCTVASAAPPLPGGASVPVHHAMGTDAHAGHGAAVPDGHHPGDDEACDSCEQTVLHRLGTAPDKALNGYSVPAPVLVIPATLQIDTQRPALKPTPWPPDSPPRSGPPTLTQQKISLLI